MVRICFLLMFFNILKLCICGSCFMDIEKSITTFADGKSLFEEMKSRSMIPKHGQCWKDAMADIQDGCKHLTHDVQNRLALNYLNCFLEDLGRSTYPCDVDEPILSCTKDMSDVDRGSFTTFYTSTHNICHFLESHIWHQETEQTIKKLAHNSEYVADRLDQSGALQETMIEQQNLTLRNQEIVLDKAAKLSDIISTSSDNMQQLQTVFEKSIIEQKKMIDEMFDKVTRLQTLVLGEYFGFYSMIYHAVFMVIAYLLTSTQKTASARFQLFGICISGFLVEKAIFSILKGLEEWIYSTLWPCRFICGVMALVVLVYHAYRFRHFDVINNELLMDIKRDIVEIRNSLVIKTLNREETKRGQTD